MFFKQVAKERTVLERKDDSFPFSFLKLRFLKNIWGLLSSDWIHILEESKKQGTANCSKKNHKNNFIVIVSGDNYSS